MRARVFVRHGNGFANFRANGKGPTGSVEPRHTTTP